jgi:hypothetical protein
MITAQTNGVAIARTTSGILGSTQCSNMLRTPTNIIGGITVEVYVTDVKGTNKK